MVLLDDGMVQLHGIGVGVCGRAARCLLSPTTKFKTKRPSHNMEVSHIEKTNMHNNTDAIIYHNPYCVMADT